MAPAAASSNLLTEVQRGNNLRVDFPPHALAVSASRFQQVIHAAFMPWSTTFSPKVHQQMPHVPELHQREAAVQAQRALPVPAEGQRRRRFINKAASIGPMMRG